MDSLTIKNESVIVVINKALLLFIYFIPHLQCHFIGMLHIAALPSFLHPLSIISITSGFFLEQYNISFKFCH